MTEGKSRKRMRKNRIAYMGWISILVFLCACSTPMHPAEVTAMAEATVEAASVEETTDIPAEESVTETVAETETESITSAAEESKEASDLDGSRQPVGHRIIYADGEIYGWTRYEYDGQGRRDMIIFITPTGNEYWSPVFYDGNGHVIPETVGNWSRLDENGLHLEVGMEDSRGRRTPMAEYQYDEKGNLTDYWYMFSDGRYLCHVVYQYDSHDRMIREETYLARNNRLESYVEYIYNGEGLLTRKNEVEDVRRDSVGVYVVYQHDEDGRLIREETVWGGRTHDYIDYFYNEDGELIREYHFLEDPMMGGSYTVEYLFEAVDDSAG